MSLNTELNTRIKSLPPLSDSVYQIQSICNNPDSSISDLIKVVEKDPMLTANLLKAANSPLYGFSREIKTVNQAISLFGMATVKGFALSSAIRQTLTIDLSPYGIDATAFSSIAQQQSALMVNWYGKVNRQMLDILAPASFLDSVGQILIAQEIIKQQKNAEFNSRIKEESSVEDTERLFFQVVSQDIAGEMFKHWRFEQKMIDAIIASDHPMDADEEVRVYAWPLKIVRTLVNVKEQFTESSIEKAYQYAEEAGLAKEPLENAIKTFNGE